MTPEHWQRIEQVYHRAMEQEPGRRAAYVAEACHGDEDLRQEVESLIERDASDPGNLLNRAAWREGGTEHSAAAAPAPGTRLGPYEVLAAIGSGGMGEVWKARDTRLGRMVAIKVSKTEFSQRFEREARAVAALNHPHICTLYDIGPNYFVMEYIDGKTLQDLIPRKGMPLSKVLSYAAQIADALATAHAAGIIHRDLKPGNIMVANDGRVKVVDFGLARVTAPPTGAAEDATFTQTADGVIAGTVSYMSPEQAQGREVDARSDIFSFGAVFYEMLTGERAFRGDSAMSTLADILHKDPRPPSEYAGDLPREVERLLARCLRKDPARRWQNMADVKVALLELKEDSESGRLSAVFPAAPRKTRMRPIWLAGGAAAVLLAAAAGWYLPHGRPPAAPVLTAVPLTSYAGEQIQPSFSPDGNQVAFAWNGPQRENWDIYVKVVGAGEPLRLTSDPAEDVSPAWAPDGRWIAFARLLSGNRYALMLISPLGGAERKLGEFGGPLAWDPSFAWSRDSKHLVVPIREESSRRNGLFALSLDTGDVRPLTGLKPAAPGDTLPRFSPDGRTLAFLRPRDNTLGDIYLLNLAPDLSPQGAPRQLIPMVICGAAWTADGRELVYTSGASVAEMQLKRVAVSAGSEPRAVNPASIGSVCPAISHPAGNAPSHLAWEYRYGDANIYRLELSGSGKAGNLQPWIASTFRDVFPQYSPDGKSIVFYSTRSGANEIWVCRADGSEPRQLTSLGAPVSGSPRWSPDSKTIAFDSNKEGVYEFYLVSAEGGSPRRMTDPPFVSFSPNWSPDGRWIYFTSDRAGALNVWKMPASGGPATQVTHNGGTGPTVSPDGTYLYYVKDPDSSLWRVPLAGGDETEVAAAIHRYSYAVTGKGVYFSVPQSSGSAGTIEFLDAATGRRSVLARTDKRLDLGLSVSPDGRYLLYPQIDYRGSNLMMIENFH